MPNCLISDFSLDSGSIKQDPDSSTPSTASAGLQEGSASTSSLARGHRHDHGLSALEQQRARYSRDERKARELGIAFSIDEIINLPMDEFNDLLSKHDLTEEQLNLCRDIRRRGKNKVLVAGSHLRTCLALKLFHHATGGGAKLP